MDDIFRYFNIISKHSNVYLDNALSEFELCSCHRVFIHKIFENPGITRDKIKNIVHIHPSNTTRTIDYLEEKGYIIKKTNEQDKRICELYPTEKLAKVHTKLIKTEEEWIEIITKDFSLEDKEKYRELLKLSSNHSVDCIHGDKK